MPLSCRDKHQEYVGTVFILIEAQCASASTGVHIYNTVEYTHNTVTGTAWTFVYKEVPICACVAAKQFDGISPKFYCFLMIFWCFYQVFAVNLSFNRCDMFAVGGACICVTGRIHPPNRARSPAFSDPNHQSPKKKKIVLSPKKKYQCITRLKTAVFTLHSGHVENVLCARYIVSHQSRNFYRAPLRCTENLCTPPCVRYCASIRTNRVWYNPAAASIHTSDNDPWHDTKAWFLPVPLQFILTPRKLISTIF